jgi:hypothetical protein
MKTKLNTHFAQQVIQAAATGCAHMKLGEVRDSCGLCGMEFWNTISKQQRPRAGLVISQAAEKGLLPLKSKGTTQRNHQVFEKI